MRERAAVLAAGALLAACASSREREGERVAELVSGHETSGNPLNDSFWDPPIEVRYESAGAGSDAVVFVHGWTCDRTVWRAQLDALKGRARTLAIDLPGHGASDKREIPYTMDVFAGAIAAAMRDARVERAVLVGHSMGTPVIRRFYRRYPQKTRALVAVDGALRPFLTDPKQIEAFVARYEGPGGAELRRQFAKSLLTPSIPEDARARLEASMGACPQHVAASAMRGMMDPAIWGDDRIDVPLQVILAKSPLWPPDYEAYVRSIAADVDWRAMDGVGHFLMLEKPDDVSRMLEEFLGKQGVLAR